MERTEGFRNCICWVEIPSGFPPNGRAICGVQPSGTVHQQAICKMQITSQIARTVRETEKNAFKVTQVFLKGFTRNGISFQKTLLFLQSYIWIFIENPTFES